MKKLMILFVPIVLLAVAPVHATEKQTGGKAGTMITESVETFVTGCKQELRTFCKDVSPGEGRLLACLYAHEDKISPKCDRALLSAAAQLDSAITALGDFAGACLPDLNTYCADVQPGEGRLIDCLSKNQKTLTKECATQLEKIK